MRSSVAAMPRLDPESRARKTAENRARKAVAAAGHRLRRCPVRTPGAEGFGRYRIEDANGRVVIGGGMRLGFTAPLSEVLDWLAARRAGLLRG